MSSPSAPHRLDLVVQPSDVDELGHVSNQVYLRWVLEAATDHSDAVGYRHDDYRALGAIFVVRRHELDYLSPAFAGERLVAATWVAEWKGVSSLRATEITRVGDDVVVARAVTRWVFVDFATGRPRRIPEQVRADFGG